MGLFSFKKKASDAPNYTLRTNSGTYENKDLSIAGFAEHLNHFTHEEWDFMTLSSSAPIKGVTFIQIGSPDAKTNFKMTVEIGLSNPDKIEMYRCYTDSKDEALRILADYFEKQEIPDYKSWNDVSDEMN